MSAERFNPETPESNSSVVQPESAASFRVPLPKEGSSESKSRRRKKRKKSGPSQAGLVPRHTDSKERSRQSKAGKTDLLGLKEGELTLWQRPEDTPGNRKSAMFGSKVVEATREPKIADRAEEKPVIALASDAPETTRTKDDRSQAANEHLAPRPPEWQLDSRPVGQPEAAEERRRAEDRNLLEVQSPKEKPLEFHPQPMIQHQGREQPAERPTENQAEGSDKPHHIQRPEMPPPSYEPPAEVLQPPPQPPDPLSYRRRFWNEESPRPESPDRDSLPPLHDYGRPAYEAHHNEPPYPAVTQRVEVPTASRYESDIPPGYQRTTGDVNRAAWTGVLAGWWLGRRSKRKAVERARKAGIQEGMARAKPTQPPIGRPRGSEQYASPRLEAEPIHTYQSPDGGRMVVQPLSTETRNPLRPPEQVSNPISRVAEQIAAPMASVAVFERAVNRPLAERFEVPVAARMAAAKAAESVIGRAAEAPLAAPGAALGARSERQLGKRELMKLSKDIKVDGVPLKEIYKADKIDEEGLRAIVDTYLKGGDIRQQLAQEVAVKEQSYERDPMLRHQRMIGERERQPVSRTSGNKADRYDSAYDRGGATGAGGGIVQTVGHTLSSVAASAESSAKTAGRALASGAKTAQRDIIDNSNTADWLSVTAVVVLYSIILILLLA